METATDPNGESAERCHWGPQNSTRDLAWPMADPALTQEILDLFNQATHYHQVKKGVNEGIPFLDFHLEVPPPQLTCT